MIIPLEPRGTQDSPHRRFFRSKSDRKIAGICGGIAQLFQIDSTVVRLSAVFLCFVTGILPFLIAYLIAWALIPEK
ncbi:MAG: PspC domain-containing protein [Verrucomicrobia bacterium]|nr:PspC domain-containing protein [Verrucomicrobiota bacterium]